jgi:hypothetical protein
VNGIDALKVLELLSLLVAVTKSLHLTWKCSGEPEITRTFRAVSKGGMSLVVQAKFTTPEVIPLFDECSYVSEVDVRDRL